MTVNGRIRVSTRESLKSAIGALPGEVVRPFVRGVEALTKTQSAKSAILNRDLSFSQSCLAVAGPLGPDRLGSPSSFDCYPFARTRKE